MQILIGLLISSHPRFLR